MKPQLNLTADESGLIDVTVKVNGEVATKTIDVYVANEFLVAAYGQNNALSHSELRDLTAKFFGGVSADWTVGQAVAFWRAVQTTIADEKKAEADSATPS